MAHGRKKIAQRSRAEPALLLLLDLRVELSPYMPMSRNGFKPAQRSVDHTRVIAAYLFNPSASRELSDAS